MSFCFLPTNHIHNNMLVSVDDTLKLDDHSFLKIILEIMSKVVWFDKFPYEIRSKASNWKGFWNFHWWERTVKKIGYPFVVICRYTILFLLLICRKILSLFWCHRYSTWKIHFTSNKISFSFLFSNFNWLSSKKQLKFNHLDTTLLWHQFKAFSWYTWNSIEKVLSWKIPSSIKESWKTSLWIAKWRFTSIKKIQK